MQCRRPGFGTWVGRKAWKPSPCKLHKFRSIMPCVCGSHSVVPDSLSTPWNVACQAPVSLGFSGQEYWSGLPCAPPRDLPDPGMEPTILHCRQMLYHLSHQGSQGVYLKLMSTLLQKKNNILKNPSQCDKQKHPRFWITVADPVHTGSLGPRYKVPRMGLRQGT